MKEILRTRTCGNCRHAGRLPFEAPCNECVEESCWESKGSPPAGPRPAEGVKFDSAKPRYDLYPPEALEGTVKILTFGASKYSDRNWEKGMAWGRVFSALMRHLWAWWRGESNDPETGESHLHRAACCIAFLQTYEARKTGTDDRPSSSKKN